MKIAITNNIALNGGDAAILLGMTKALKQRFGQDTEFVVTGTYPEVCAKLYPYFKWRTVIGRVADTTPYNHIRVLGRIFRVLKRYCFYLAAYLRRHHFSLYRLLLCRYDADTLNEYATSDYIISSGGTYLIESYGITSQYIDYRISLILNKPLVLYTQSMGPFVRKQTKRRLKWVFNRCHTILLRDAQSAKNVLSLNIINSTLVHVVPDAAFALGDIDTIMKRKSDYIGKHGKVAVSVRDWSHTNDIYTMPNYCKCIADVVVKLIDMGYCVHFFSTCQGIPSYDDDNKIVDSILTLIPASYHAKVVRYNDYLTISMIMDYFKQMDFIIATRLHMSILALITGTPVYPIAYEFKTTELFHSLGYENVDTLDNIKANKLGESLVSFIDSFTSTRRIEIYNQVFQYVKNSMNAPVLII